MSLFNDKFSTKKCSIFEIVTAAMMSLCREYLLKGGSVQLTLHQPVYFALIKHINLASKIKLT
jgi:hypothetical protein